MNIPSLLDSFARILKSDEYFDSVKIISAYPFTVKPTMLKENVIALGFSDISINDCCIGGDETDGYVKIFADIFVPLKEDGRIACQIFTRMCDDLKDMNIVAVSAQRIYSDSKSTAYVMKTQFTFRGAIEFGGDSGGQ